MTETLTITEAKQPRRISPTIRDLIEQHSKAVAVRNKAADKIEKLDAALFALGWFEE